jgi:hypothetical protein
MISAVVLHSKLQKYQGLHLRIGAKHTFLKMEQGYSLKDKERSKEKRLAHAASLSS